MDIDLAKKTIGHIRKTQRARRLLDKTVIFGWAGLSLVLIVIASINLWINKANQLLNSRIKTAEKAIEAQAKIESQQVYLNSKLASFSSLIKTHELHQAVAETVFSVIPTGTSLRGFEVTETGLISLSGTVPNWLLFSQLLTNLNQSAGPLTIKQVTVKKVDFSGDGVLNFNLEMLIAVPND